MTAGRPLTLTGPLAPLAQLLGELGLCEAMGGVAYSTVYRWDKGLAVPQAPAQARLTDIFLANGLQPYKWPRRRRKPNKGTSRRL